MFKIQSFSELSQSITHYHPFFPLLSSFLLQYSTSRFSETRHVVAGDHLLSFPLIFSHLILSALDLLSALIRTQWRACVSLVRIKPRIFFVPNSRFAAAAAAVAGRLRLCHGGKSIVRPSLRSERFSGVNESDLESGDIHSRWLSSWEPQPWGTTQPRPRGLLSRRRRLLLPSSSSSSSSSSSPLIFLTAVAAPSRRRAEMESYARELARATLVPKGDSRCRMQKTVKFTGGNI